jgi:hypothetical protein
MQQLGQELELPEGHEDVSGNARLEPVLGVRPQDMTHDILASGVMLPNQRLNHTEPRRRRDRRASRRVTPQAAVGLHLAEHGLVVFASEPNPPSHPNTLVSTLSITNASSADTAAWESDAR